MIKKSVIDYYCISRLESRELCVLRNMLFHSFLIENIEKYTAYFSLESLKNDFVDTMRRRELTHLPTPKTTTVYDLCFELQQVSSNIIFCKDVRNNLYYFSTILGGLND